MTLKPLLTLLFSSSLLYASAQTPLAAGDIAFTGLNSAFNTTNDFVNTPQSESNREFSFVLLKTVTAGTTIFFTDFGWRSDAQAFQSANPCGANTGSLTDGVVRWQATGTVNYGTQVVIRTYTNPKANIGTATGFQATYNTLNPTPQPASLLQYMTLAAPGESIFAYTGTLAAPTLLGGICGSPNGWVATLNNCDQTTAPSTLPNVLNNALNGNSNYAFAVLPASGGTGYSMRLKPTVKVGADAAAARATIYTAANWESNGTGTGAYPLIASASVLPVTFGKISAVITGKNLSVNWETTAETNCKQYDVQASADGTNWKSIGTVQSKAPQGNASTALSYTLNLDIAGISIAFFGLSALLLFMPRRRKYVLITMVVLSAILIACNKNNGGADISENTKVFVRIAQEDIDGSINYSKVIEAIFK